MDAAASCVLRPRGEAPGAHGTRQLRDAGGVYTLCVWGAPRHGVGLYRGAALLERVDTAGPPEVMGLWYPPRLSGGGSSSQPCLVAGAAGTPYTPPTLTVHLPIGPVLLRMAGWAQVTEIVGLPGCGMVIVGRKTDDVAVVAHTLHPLTPPAPMAGACWDKASHILIAALPSAKPDEAELFVVSTGGAASAPPPATRLARMQVRAIDLPDAVEKQCVVKTAATGTLSGVRTCQGGHAVAWAPASGGSYVVVAAPSEGRVALAKLDAVEVPFSCPAGVVDAAVVQGQLVLLTAAAPASPPHLLLYTDPSTLLATVPVGVAPQRPVALRSLQGDLMVVCDGPGGAQWLRYDVAAEVRDPLARLLFQCVSAAVGDRALVAAIHRAVLGARERGDGRDGGAEWRALVHTLLPPPPHNNTPAPAADGSAPSAYDTLQQLLRRRSGGALSPVLLPALARGAAAAAPPPPRPSGDRGPRLPDALRPGVACVLHLLHESLRASVVWRVHLPALGGLLLELTAGLGWGQYRDHYRTLYPAVHAALAAQGAASAAAPMDYATPPVPAAGGDAAWAVFAGNVVHPEWFSGSAAPPDLLGFAHGCMAAAAGGAAAPPPRLRRPFPYLSVKGGDAAAAAATAAGRVLAQVVTVRYEALAAGNPGAAAPPLQRAPVLPLSAPAAAGPCGFFSDGGSALGRSLIASGLGQFGAPTRAPGLLASALPLSGGAPARPSPGLSLKLPPPPAAAGGAADGEWGGAGGCPHERVVSGMLRRGVEGGGGVELDVLARLPLGPAVLALQSVFVCRQRPPAAWPPQLLTAVGRCDVATLRGTHRGESGKRVAGAVLGGRGRAGGKAQEWGRCFTTLHPLLPYEDEGMLPQKPPRAEESGISGGNLGVDVGNGPPSVGHRLLWSKDSRLAVAQTLLCSALPVALSGSGDDFGDPTAQQQHLAAAAKRVLALPCGRGMLTLTTMTSLSGSTLPVPPLVLCGRRSRDQAYTTLDLTGHTADTTLWPEFLNGCSAALRLQAQGELGSGRVFRDWIANVVSPKATPSPAAAGVVLGLGLLGYIEYLSGSELYSLMCPRHEATTVALLLGLAACHRGTGEKRVSGMLSLHLAPITPHYTEQDIAAGMQAAALIGTGLLYQGSCHRLMSDMLLGELSRPPSDEHSCNLHSYALCTGFSLGLICLCRGGSAPHLSDLPLLDRLLSLLSCTKREYMDSCGDTPLHAPTRGDTGPGTGIPASMAINPGAKAQACSKVLVGPLVDTNITAPAAAAALALMYMMTGNDVVHSALVLPTTASLLQAVSPDAAMVRTIAAGLVKWDGIAATAEWIEQAAPASLLRRADVALSPGVRQHLSVLYHSCRAAAMFVLGLRFAGTEDKAVRDTILAELATFTALKVPNKTVLDPVINATLLAACCVMAGTGCAEVFSALRALQKRKDASYGSHMAVAMGIGLLFLGAGHRTLASTPPSVAALFMALYPRFPTVPTDNTYHYQFIRPLYTLATIPRTLESRDADTGEPCPVRVRINGVEATTPCLMPRTDALEVEVACDEYFPMALSSTVPAERAALNSGVFWVQRKLRRAGPTAAYAACYDTGPLASQRRFGGRTVDPVRHAVATAAQRSYSGPSILDTWDVRLAVAVAEFGPGAASDMSELLGKLFPPFISTHLNDATNAAARRAVAALAAARPESLTVEEIQALVWYGLPVSHKLLTQLARRQPRGIQ